MFNKDNIQKINDIGANIYGNPDVCVLRRLKWECVAQWYHPGIVQEGQRNNEEPGYVETSLKCLKYFKVFTWIQI